MLYRVVRRNLSALPNRTVRRVTGTPATTFRDFAADHRDVWMPDQPQPIREQGPGSSP